MKYMMLRTAEQEALLADLERMPRFLAAAFEGVTARDATRRGPDDTFAPVEQSWHLADLEREAFAVRIQRLLAEADPVLPDFDGAGIARERGYRAKSLAQGITAFQQARFQNIAVLRALSGTAWTRRGSQEGVGPVSLCDLPAMMAEHDAAHRAEIEAWKGSTVGRVRLASREPR